MNKWVKGTLITVGSLVGFLLALSIVAAVLVQNKSFQNRVLQSAVKRLSDQLQTRVAIDSIDISFVGQSIDLFGLAIDDQQGRQLLQMERLNVHLDMWALLHHEVRISHAAVEGLSAHLLKPSKDTPSNYQFMIDAFKKPKDSESESSPTDSSATTSSPSLQFDLQSLELKRVRIQYNDVAASFDLFEYDKSWQQTNTALLRDFHYEWQSKAKKGPIDNTLHVTELRYEEKNEPSLSISGLHYISDNHLPRKNTGKPHRGFFDVGHLDATADMQLTLQHLSNDSLALTLTECHALDSVTGFDVKDLHLRLTANKREIQVCDLTLQQRKTTVNIDSAYIQLRDTIVGRDFEYHVPLIRVQTVLQDIARPFAPVLSQFTQPLQVSTSMNGTRDHIQFGNVRIQSPDKQLTIRANGTIQNLRDSRQLAVRFKVQDMKARGNIKRKIINQFPVKKLMMEAYDALGTIGYTGQFAVLWRREQFSGVLTTEAGALTFDFALDENNKYLSGHAKTTDFQIAKVADVPKVGPVSFSAQFKVDISKQRTAQMRRLKGGKLPIGSVKGLVSQASYKGIKVTNLDVDIESDGATAVGSVLQRNKLIDLSCSFTMTSTTSIQHVKVKPKLQLHSRTDEERQARAERKEQQRQAKAERKEQKRQERAERREQKRQAKAEKKENKNSEPTGNEQP